MNKFIVLSSLAITALALGLAARSEAAPDTPCVRKTFKTELVKEACAKGGQPAAKEAMKVFMKQHRVKSCNQCHDKLAPSYSLKPDAYAQFGKLGGK